MLYLLDFIQQLAEIKFSKACLNLFGQAPIKKSDNLKGSHSVMENIL